MKNKRILTTLLSVMLVGLTMIQAQPQLFVGPNQPLGEGKGIHPGRVVWVHSPGVAKWDLETGLWVEDRWNDQAKADAMIKEAVIQLTGEKKVKKAWKALFRSFNETKRDMKRGYKKGEKIAIRSLRSQIQQWKDTAYYHEIKSYY